MNDFTKEELKAILWHITTKSSIEPGNDLVPKIQDMIKSYCEHNFEETDVETFIWRCTKCGAE